MGISLGGSNAMRISVFFIAMLALLSPSYLVSATPVPAEIWDPSDPTDELNLYEIYNILYGTSLSSNAELEAFAIDPGEIFPFVNGGEIDATARYADFGQAFGIYDAGGDSTPVPVTGFGLSVTGSMTVPPGTFGIYDQVTGGGNNRWRSEAALNGGDDHMVAYLGLNDEIMIGFEDYAFNDPRIDFDYNDLVLTLIGDDVVAEPASLLLVGFGLAGVVYRRFVVKSNSRSRH
jgi:hypothetical protein